MFFDLKMEPGTTYVCWTRKSLHITGVAIEKGYIAKISVKYQTKEFIFATVSQVIPQASLNLVFSGGEQITFTAKGNATVSLFGYWNDNEDEQKEGNNVSDMTVEPPPVILVNGDGKEEKCYDYSYMILEYESSLAYKDGDDEGDESGEEESSDSDNEEPLKVKVVKVSAMANTKKGPKDQNGVAAEEEEEEKFDDDNASLLVNVDHDEKFKSGEKESSDSENKEPLKFKVAKKGGNEQNGVAAKQKEKNYDKENVSLLENDKDGSGEEKSSDSDNKEPLKVKTNAKKGKEQNGVAAKQEEKNYDKVNVPLLGNVYEDEENDEEDEIDEEDSSDFDEEVEMFKPLR